MKLLFFLLVVMVFGIFYFHDADAQSFTKSHSVAFSTPEQDERGFSYDIQVPDLYIKESDCDLNKVSVATQWIRWRQAGFWIESGVTVGAFADGSDDDTIGDLCLQNETAYYAYSYIPLNGSDNVFQEFNLGIVNVGDSENFKISDVDNDDYWQIHYGDSEFARANIFVTNQFDLEFLDVGIESEIEPDSEYSSIPNTHFRNFEIYRDGQYVTNILSFLSSDSTHYHVTPSTSLQETQ